MSSIGIVKPLPCILSTNTEISFMKCRESNSGQLGPKAQILPLCSSLSHQLIIPLTLLQLKVQGLYPIRGFLHQLITTQKFPHQWDWLHSQVYIHCRRESWIGGSCGGVVRGVDFRQRYGFESVFWLKCYRARLLILAKYQGTNNRFSVQ